MPPVPALRGVAPRHSSAGCSTASQRWVERRLRSRYVTPCSRRSARRPGRRSGPTAPTRRWRPSTARRRRKARKRRWKQSPFPPRQLRRSRRRSKLSPFQRAQPRMKALTTASTTVAPAATGPPQARRWWVRVRAALGLAQPSTITRPSAPPPGPFRPRPVPTQRPRARRPLARLLPIPASKAARAAVVAAAPGALRLRRPDPSAGTSGQSRCSLAQRAACVRSVTPNR